MLSISVAAVAQVPIDGFFPMVGLALTDEFDEDFNFFPFASSSPSGTMLGPNGNPFYDLALLDTGAGFSVLTSQAYDDFNLDGPYPGESDGFFGTEVVTIGGATGQLDAHINDPFGLYVGGLQGRSSAGASLTMNHAALSGQTNTSTITLPPESDLPNIVGLPFASQYATRIRNDAPQVFELEGKTIRTPSIDFLPRGSGGNGITRKAPLLLNPGAAFAQPPTYLPNIQNFDIDNPEENPTIPTIIQGALFMNASATNAGSSLGNKEFFFDTGASVTVVSEFNALLLGFDVTTDSPEFTVSIVGSGGTLQDVPGFFVDQFTIPALGGSITANNVPVLVLDVTNPADPGNVVEGIIGTNLLAGRNIVIDPNPSAGAGGQSAGVYISDPVTTAFNWTTAAASAAWSTGGSWNAAATPTYLSKATLQNTGAAGKEAVVSGEQQAWDVTVGGASGAMTVRIASGGKLTTFSGVTVNDGGVVQLQDSALDTQYIDVRGGTLTGAGDIRTGSGPITGQVEVIDGVIAPGNGVGTLSIDGRLATSGGAEFQFELGGTTAGTGYDQLVINGDAALAGKLSVSLVNGFTPAVGALFELMTYEAQGGEFATLDLPGGFQWEVIYGLESLMLEVIGEGLAGDFNADGTVNAADYTVWRDGLGSVYTQADYTDWKNNYGATNVSMSVSVPEPASLVLLAFALSAFTKPRR
ncbi:retropepsin-like aspartic protease [Botrimarina mediterranea]|nr:retropepsin-like aspartic protease [Botrimarina mediterranea]